jgi:putative acetyltransferase
MFLTVRPPQTSDAKIIRQLLQDAFKGDAEADLVEALRKGAHHGLLELVAREVNELSGYIAFSPVFIPGIQMHMRGMALAPMAVRPARQKQGIGKELIRKGLERLKNMGVGYVVVLGDPAYYRRFGFVSAQGYRLTCEFPALPDAFQVLTLQQDGSLPAGKIRYTPEFDRFK